MNQSRINELKALLDFAGRQSTTRTQLVPPDGKIDKNEIQILASVLNEVLDALVSKPELKASELKAPEAKPVEAKTPVPPTPPVTTPASEVKKS